MCCGMSLCDIMFYYVFSHEITPHILFVYAKAFYVKYEYTYSDNL